MSDSPLEEMEVHEHAEHAEHAAHEKDSLLSQVTLTIAVMAVIAAIGGSLETTEGDKTIVAKNDAVLKQDQATDQWDEFEAKSVKKNLYQIAADQPGPKADVYKKEAAKNSSDQEKVGEKAKLVCPAPSAYGDAGSPPLVPGGATLVFEIELLDIVK